MVMPVCAMRYSGTTQTMVKYAAPITVIRVST